METAAVKPRSKTYFVAPVLILLALVYIGFLLYQAVYVNYQTNTKIDALNESLRENKIDKQNLEVLIAYYQTDSFRELEARKKLGLKMPGEKVIKVDLAEETKPKPQAAIAEPIHRQKTNLEYWVDYLFYPDI